MFYGNTVLCFLFLISPNRKGYVNTENSQMACTGAKSHKATKSMAKLISQPYDKSQVVIYLYRGDGAI